MSLSLLRLIIMFLSPFDMIDFYDQIKKCYVFSSFLLLLLLLLIFNVFGVMWIYFNFLTLFLLLLLLLIMLLEVRFCLPYLLSNSL